MYKVTGILKANGGREVKAYRKTDKQAKELINEWKTLGVIYDIGMVKLSPKELYQLIHKK
jgi:hypothetical protein